MAARPGFEPGSGDSKSPVLPLHHRALRNSGLRILLAENNYAIEGSVAGMEELWLKDPLFIPTGVGAEDLEHGRLVSQGLDGLLYIWVLTVTVNVYQEDVVTQELLGGS